MPRAAQVFEIFIASPGDTFEEREIVTKAIHEWNAIHYRKTDAFLHPVKWESHSYPTLDGRPQSIINKKLLSHADLLVALFKWRLGQDSGQYVSGTIEEIEECYQAGIPILLYFYDTPPSPPLFGLTSYLFGGYAEEMQKYGKALSDFDHVVRYRKRYESRGIIGPYRTFQEFEILIRRQLGQAVAELLTKHKAT